MKGVYSSPDSVNGRVTQVGRSRVARGRWGAPARQRQRRVLQPCCRRRWRLQPTSSPHLSPTPTHPGPRPQNALFPSNTYVEDSGGDPTVIPDLTFEEFQARCRAGWRAGLARGAGSAGGPNLTCTTPAPNAASCSRRRLPPALRCPHTLPSHPPCPHISHPQKFYADYYHPSNARFWFYGDDDGGWGVRAVRAVRVWREGAEGLRLGWLAPRGSLQRRLQSRLTESHASPVACTPPTLEEGLRIMGAHLGDNY